MADNSDILALLGDLLRATDRQTDALREEMRRNTEEMREEMRRNTEDMREDMRQEFTTIFNRFADAVTDGFSRVDKKMDGLASEVKGLNRRADILTEESRRTGQKLDVVVEHVGHLTEKVDSIAHSAAQAETRQVVAEDVIRRLVILENIVLPKAS